MAAPLSYAQTFGPAGDPVTHLGWGLAIISLAVCAIVAALLLGGVFRRRTPAQDPQTLAVHEDAGGMVWIYVGVGITIVVLIGCAIWTVSVLAAVTRPVNANGLTIEVDGEQWWWNIRYRNDDPSQTFLTANEIHIPVGQPVRLELASVDVIHSFWVPQLAGKTDVIPGQTNVAWLQADKPGRYRGQCGEYCGAQHAHMALFVVADTPEDFATWRANELKATTPPTGGDLVKGEAVFTARCGACHTVRGTNAGGLVGPDLTHLMSRKTIAAGLLDNTRGDLAAWIEGAQAMKPGTRMPSVRMPGTDLVPLLAYLTSLH
jgi:cytochrome c oxidase subunit II